MGISIAWLRRVVVASHCPFLVGRPRHRLALLASAGREQSLATSLYGRLRCSSTVRGQDAMARDYSLEPFSKATSVLRSLEYPIHFDGGWLPL
jgi:hypothetical protein